MARRKKCSISRVDRSAGRDVELREGLRQLTHGFWIISTSCVRPNNDITSFQFDEAAPDPLGHSMGVRNPEPVVIDWSFRPAARISVVTRRLFDGQRIAPPGSSDRISVASTGRDQHSAADRVTTRHTTEEPRLWIRAFNDEKGLSVDCSSTAFRFVLSLTPKPCFFSAAATDASSSDIDNLGQPSVPVSILIISAFDRRLSWNVSDNFAVPSTSARIRTVNPLSPSTRMR